MHCKKINTLLFVHDGPLYRDRNGAYYGVGLNDALRRRYLSIARQVVFLMRVSVLPEQDKARYTPIRDAGFRVIEIPDFKSPRAYFTKRKQARHIIEAAVAGSDAVIARLPSGAGSLAVEAATASGTPLLAEMVACTRDTYWYHSWLGKLIAPYFYLRQRRIMRRVRYCMYVSRDFLQRRYPVSGAKASCSNVELPDMQAGTLQARMARIAARNRKTPLLLGSVGNVSMRLKGHQDVIRAIARLKKQGIRIEYTIAGGGNPKRLQNLIRRYGLQHQVDLKGALPHRNIFEFMDALDVYIQPSRTEGLPRAVVEAMSRACPVIGSRTGGIPELVHPRGLFRPGSVKEIAELLKTIDQSWMQEEARRSFQVAQDYDHTLLGKKRQDFYSFFLGDTKLSKHEPLQAI